MNRRAYVLGALVVALGSLIAVALRAFAEAAFLGAYGAAQMPWLPIASAAGFAVATLGYDALVRIARARTVDAGLLVVLGGAAAAAPMLLARGAPPVVLVVALAAASQVAGLALWNRVAASVAGRDARRTLPRAAAAVTAGGAVAGLGAGALIARVGLEVVPYVAAALTVVVLVLVAAQERALVQGGAPGAVTAATGPSELAPLQRRLLAALVVVAVLEAIVATVVDLQFLRQLQERYTGDAIAIALALFYGGTNAILFALQTTAAPRLLVTRSLPFTAAIHPVLVIASYLGFAAAPGFFGIAGTRTADQVLRLATSRTSQEVSLSALPPEPRARWKVLLRGALWPLGAAAAGLALLAVGPAAPARLAEVAIAIAAVWAIAARIAARRFQAALAAPLGIRAVRREDARRIDLEALRRWTHAAGDSNARRAAIARAALARAQVDTADLGDHLRDDEPEVRAAMYDQLARDRGALAAELRAAIAIEDDDHALALGIKALALRGDPSGIARGRSRAGLSREVDDAVELAQQLAGGSAPLGRLCEVEPRWAIELVRRGDRDASGELCAAAAVAAQRAGALRVIACAPAAGTLPVLAAAAEAGELAALEAIDEPGARALAAVIGGMPALARAAIARALGGTRHDAPVIAALIDDRDPEVAHAALRTAIANGDALPAERVAAARATALAALVAHLDARDAAHAWTACARAELELATRRCVARLTWTAAVEAASAGRDPAPIAAVARRLVGDRELDRGRALDVAQELETRGDALVAIERWLGAPGERGDARALATFDPWLARLAAGELGALEPVLEALRRPALFASIAGPALAQLAERAARRRVDGELFRIGDAGDAMYVVAAGELVARRPGAPDRSVAPGGVVGELAVLSHAPRAATVTGAADVLAIDRAAFADAARRAPELALGLSATLAGWLAPNRPDVL